MEPLSYSEFYHLRLLLDIGGLGPVKIAGLLSAFHSFKEIFSASVNSLCGVEGINRVLAERIVAGRADIPQYEISVEQEMKRLESMGGRCFTFWDDGYPSMLKNIYDPPPIINVIGSLESLNGHVAAIVGTRLPTAYGKKAADMFASELASAGVVIVSGLARGIDTIAHNSALKSGGKTIAVLGTGLDVIYPAENKQLAERIAASGALISEFPLGTGPNGTNFPRRNRIISGISDAVVVVETGDTGGAMITADFAADQGKELYSVPGNIGSPQSEGTNELIKRGGAKLLNSTEDILSDLGVMKNRSSVENEKSRAIEQLGIFEQQILRQISDEPISIDAISNKTGISVSDCLVYLLQMEFNGIVRQLPGKTFIIG